VPEAGDRIGGRYRLDDHLAAGGMGTVWLGRDELLRRAVAVKSLHVQQGLSPADRELVAQRAMREARITARLHHPHAVQMFDVVDEPDGPCLIMEYVPSRSLQEVVRASGPLSPADAARVGTQIAAALAAAHRVGIVHRDVKPGNVLIADDGTAKITDFGISHAFDDVTLTSTGMVTGTPAFLAPEVARGASADFASDVYSLGATLYYAVEGDSPFGTDANPMAVLHRVASEPPRPARRAGPLTPLLAAMMSPRPSARPRMVDIASRLPDLHPVMATSADSDSTAVMTPTRAFAAPPPAGPPPARPSPVRPHSFPAPAGTAGPQPRHRRGWLLLVIAVVVVLAAAVTGTVLLSDSGGSGQANGPASLTASASKRTSATSRHATSPSATASSTSPSAQAPSSNDSPSTAEGKITDADLATAVQQYFQLVPAHLDAGWARLTAHFQNGRAQDRQTYGDYWGSISRVDVSDLQGHAPHSASARLTYHYKDGRVVTQQTTFRFVRQDGVLKIDDES
jgi:serine/threonine protein kinase